MINCKTYNEIRKTLLNSVLKLKPNFLYHNEREKLCFLLSCENLFDDVAKFVWDAMELRKHLTNDVLNV